MELRKLLKQKVKTVLHPYLAEQGFTEFTDLAAWRKGERWIDCVEVMPLGATEFGIPRRLGGEIDANAATFSLQIGCYYTDVHRLLWIAPLSERPRCPRGQRAREPECHRLRSLARSYKYGNVQGTLYPSADDGSDLDHAVGDALQALRSRGFAWLDMTHDIDAFLARVHQDPSEYLENQGGPIGMSDEERIEFENWKARHGIAEGESFVTYGAPDPPAFLVRLQPSLDLRDHTAMDTLPPHGDLLYGMLVGSDRIDEALNTMRRDGDPASDELRYAEMLILGFPKSSINAARKREGAYRGKIRQHLAMLEADLDHRASA